MSQTSTKFIANNAITNAKASQLPANTIKGNNTGSSADASDLSISAVQSMLSIPTGASPLPISSGGTNNSTFISGQMPYFDGTKLADSGETWDSATGRLFINSTTSIGGSNAGIQYSDASAANRGQIKLHSYFNGTSVAGISTLTSRSGTIGTNTAVVAGQDYSKWTAQAGATTPGSAPISGTFAFKANTVNSLTVTSDFHVALTNLAGTLGDRLYLSSEGALQLPNYGVGISHFDSSGNITSSLVSLTSEVTGILPIGSGGTGQITQQAALNALAGAVTSAQFLRGNGTNILLSAIQVTDVPTLNQNTTGTALNITASSNSTLTTLSALSLPTTQLSGTIAAAQFPALTGDITTSAGSLSTILATVNSNVGSFGSSTSIPSLTVNAKGLVTAASGNAVIAPASTLSGTTLNSSVVSSSLTSVGTITSGTWTGTTIAVANGGTGQTSYTDGQLLIGNTSGNTLTKATLTAGSNITITNGNGSIQIAASGSAPSYNYTAQTTTYSAVINDYISASGASFTITLPTAVGQSGKSIIIEHNGTSVTQVYTLNTTSSQTIGGIASGSYALYTNGEILEATSDNSNWRIKNHKTITALASSPAVTPSAGFGTVTASVIKTKRIGDTLECTGSFTSGTTAASTASLGLPITIDTSKIQTGSAVQKVGYWTQVTNTLQNLNTATITGDLFFDGSDTTNIYLGYQVGSKVYTKFNVSASIASTIPVTFHFSVPVSGWQP